jgi:uncharacterized protein (DUF488 family)
MADIGSSGWYRNVVEQLSRGKLTAARVAVFAPWEVTILVEEHEPEVIASTERLLAGLAPEGTRARIVSLQTFEQEASVVRCALAASGR